MIASIPELARTYRAPAVARRLAEAANRFLDALTPEQRARASFPFDDEDRYFWHYTPVDRNGLRLEEMTEPQRALALALFDVALSVRGAAEARQIIALEPILRETERIERIQTPWVRDPGRYAFSVFGAPGGPDPWTWKAGGHHLGVHLTVVEREYVSSAPLFFGANPATVRYGPQAGLRTLAAEEDLARALLLSLDAEQRAVAVVDPVAPDDILTKNYRVADPNAAPRGIRLDALRGEQRERLVGLIRHYVERTAPELAANEWTKLERAGLDAVTFAWAGPAERGQGHYYAIQGPTFLIEYDNTQNNANHIHSVWRDFRNDWGADLLAAHYAADHR